MDNLNHLFKGYEEYNADNKIKKDILDKVCGDNVNDLRPEKDEDFPQQIYYHFKQKERELQ